MAVFFTDFSEYPTQSGVPAGWTTRWSSSNVTYAIVDAGGGNKLLRMTRSTSDERGLSWNAPGSVADVEVVMRCRYTETAPSAFGTERNTALVRGGGANLNNSVGYISTAWTHGTTPSQRIVQLRRLATDFQGATINLGSSQISDIPANTWFWIRLRANGTTIQTKFWLDGTSEPSSWTVTQTDANLASGFVGVMGRGSLNGTQHHEFDRIGVGTGGDPAPTETPVEAAEGVFEVDDEVLVTWVGEAPEVPESAGVFEVSDTVEVSWAGEAPPLPGAGGSFFVADLVTVEFTGERSASANFEVEDEVLISWTGVRGVTPAVFEVPDVVTVTWFGHRVLTPGAGTLVFLTGKFPGPKILTGSYPESALSGEFSDQSLQGGL